jgi:SH3 domain
MSSAANTQKQAFFDLLATLNEDPGKQTSKWSEKEMAFFSSLKNQQSPSQSVAQLTPPSTPAPAAPSRPTPTPGGRPLPVPGAAPRRPGVPPPALPTLTSPSPTRSEAESSKTAFYDFLLSFADESSDQTQREEEFFARMQQSVGIDYSENMPSEQRRARRREIVTVFIENKDLSRGANADALFTLLSSEDTPELASPSSAPPSSGAAGRAPAPAPPRPRRAFPMVPAPSLPTGGGDHAAVSPAAVYGEEGEYAAPCPPAPTTPSISSSTPAAPSSSSSSGMAAAAGRRAPPPRPTRQGQQRGLSNTVGRRGGGALGRLQAEAPQRSNYRMSRIWLADVAAAIDMADEEENSSSGLRWHWCLIVVCSSRLCVPPSCGCSASVCDSASVCVCVCVCVCVVLCLCVLVHAFFFVCFFTSYLSRAQLVSPCFHLSASASSTSGSGASTQEEAQWAIALFNYEKLRDDELSFRCNNIVEVLSTHTKSKGWWLVKRLDQQGICPSNYLKVITKPDGRSRVCVVVVVVVVVCVCVCVCVRCGGGGGGGVCVCVVAYGCCCRLRAFLLSCHC